MDEFQSILLRAKDDVYTHLQGGGFSRVLGQGYDFSELRAYDMSDDIRHISWINSAKLAEPYVKKMHEERELLVHISMLLDGRVLIGSKHVLMTKVLAVIAYSSVYTNSLLNVSLAFGVKFKSFEATKNIEAIENTLNEFHTIKPLGLKINYVQVQHELLKVQEQKSLFFLVGDFLDEIDLSILAQKHELCVIIIRDRWEEKPSVDFDVELVNPLSNKNIRNSLSRKALREYVQKLEEHDKKLYAHFHEYQIKYVKIYEDSEVIEKLEQLFYF